MRAALTANTGIKMAARLDAGDRATMARDMNTVPDFIRDQTVGSFAVFIRDPTPTSHLDALPAKPLARFAHMRADEERIVRDRNRELYARPPRRPADLRTMRPTARSPAQMARARRHDPEDQ